MQTSSRRDFASLAGLSLASFLSGCASPPTSQNASGIGINMKYFMVEMKDPTAMTPLASSIAGYFQKTAKSKASLVFNGTLLASHKSAAGAAKINVDPTNQRRGFLITTVTFAKDKAEIFRDTIAQTLNGSPVAVGTHTCAKPFMPFGDPLFRGVPFHFGGMMQANGVGAPLAAFSGTDGGSSAGSDQSSLKIKFAGQKFVTALGRSVDVWSWKFVRRGTNFSGQGHVTTYESTLSSEIPGQLESYSYIYQIAGDVVESSQGHLTSIT